MPARDPSKSQRTGKRGTGPNKRAGEKGPHCNGNEGTVFTAERKAAFCKLIEHDACIALAAREIGVSQATVANHRRDDPVFEAQVCASLKIFRDTLYTHARKRAIEGTIKPIYQRGVRVDKDDNREFSDQVLIRLLERHDPEFKSRSDSTSTNVNVDFAPANLAELTPEQRAKLRALLTPIDDRPQ